MCHLNLFHLNSYTEKSCLCRNKTKIVVHQRSNSKNSIRIDSRSDNLQTNLILGSNYNVFVGRFVACWRRVGTEHHLTGYRVVRDEAREWSNLSKHANFVHLFYHSVEHFTFEWSEDDRFVFHRIDDKTLSRLDDARANVVYRCHRDDEAIFSRASAFNFSVEFLSNRVE